MAADPTPPEPRKQPRGREASPAVAGAPPPSRLARVLAYRRLWTLAIVILALDQFTKAWIASLLPFGLHGTSGITVIPGFFYLAHVGNTGGAWSVFAGRSLPLALIGIAVLAAVFIWRRQLGLPHPFAQFCFGLFVGGAVGNIIDRLRFGYVVDFLDFHFGSYIYPTFNVADAAIVVGVFAYVIWSLKQPAPPAG